MYGNRELRLGFRREQRLLFPTRADSLPFLSPKTKSTEMTLYQQTHEFLKRTGRNLNQKLGQHFLIDPHTLQEIAWKAELTDADSVLEIGAGLGFLTSVLAATAKRVVAVEIDEFLYAELQLKFSRVPHIS